MLAQLSLPAGKAEKSELPGDGVHEREVRVALRSFGGTARNCSHQSLSGDQPSKHSSTFNPWRALARKVLQSAVAGIERHQERRRGHVAVVVMQLSYQVRTTFT
jgi:hypothetical protein